MQFSLRAIFFTFFFTSYIPGNNVQLIIDGKLGDLLRQDCINIDKSLLKEHDEWSWRPTNALKAEYIAAVIARAITCHTEDGWSTFIDRTLTYIWLSDVQRHPRRRKMRHRNPLGEKNKEVQGGQNRCY